MTRLAPAASSPRKNPLRTAIAGGGGMPPATSAPPTGTADSGPGQRRVMISEYCAWLRSRTGKQKRSFQEETITAYKVAARALDSWMTAEGIEDDFTGCDTRLLNQFFRAYAASHGQGGTNTKQRNLRHLFTWLEAEYDHPHPYTEQLNRYSPVKVRPSTLSEQFVADLLKITGNGRARSFADARDHALIRFLCEGVRRTEVVQLQVGDLATDLIAQPLVRVVPLKGARSEDQGRLVPLSHGTARAIVAAWARVPDGR